MTEVIEPHEVVFCGKGSSVPGWYRCALPAMALGCEWAGLVNLPPAIGITAGTMASVPDWDKYKVVIAQQWAGDYWAEHVRELKGRGIKVVYELDDDLASIQNAVDHDRRTTYTQSFVEEHLDVLELCDGLIASTEFLAETYGPLSATGQTWVCRNGLDMGRYAITRPKRETVNVGWFGGTGHRIAFSRWLEPLEKIMDDHENVRFVNIGDPVAHLLSPHLRTRSLYIPWSSLETFPAALANVDIALAPARDTNFFRGKSDLRWLESSTLKIPCVADPMVYPDIIDGVTGLHAESTDDVYAYLLVLVESSDFRLQIGQGGYDHLMNVRTIESTCMDWVPVIEDVTD